MIDVFQGTKAKRETTDQRPTPLYEVILSEDFPQARSPDETCSLGRSFGSLD